jgi:hypothetical protein
MDISGKITSDIADYKNPSARIGPGRILWYLFAGILVILLIIWIVYSISDSHGRTKIINHITKTIKDIRMYFQSSSKHSSHVSETHDKSSSIPSSSSSLIYNPNISGSSSNIEQSNQTISTALNYNSSDGESSSYSSSGMFQNDDPDSTIQSGKNSRGSAFGWSIDNELGTGGATSYTNAYNTSSSPSNV